MLAVFACGLPALAVCVLGLGDTLLHRFPALERRLLRIMRLPPL